MLVPAFVARTNIQGLNFSNFSSTTGLELVSTASVTDNYIYLTSAVNNDVGNAWQSTSTRYDRSFSVSWIFECSGGTGADGFCIQWHTANNVNGGGGGGCGRIGSSDCIHSITFATYLGSGLYWNKNNVAQTSKTATDISLRQNVYYWLDYDHWASNCKVFYSTSNTKPASANHTFSSFSFDTTSYYLGFGAATGGANDNHILKSVSLLFNNAQNSVS